METTRKIILNLAIKYMNDEKYSPHIIAKEWIDKVTETLKLRELDDIALANMWDMVWLTLKDQYHYYSERNSNLAMKYLDVQSAFTEVINAEARRRRGDQ